MINWPTWWWPWKKVKQLQREVRSLKENEKLLREEIRIQEQVCNGQATKIQHLNDEVSNRDMVIAAQAVQQKEFAQRHMQVLRKETADRTKLEDQIREQIAKANKLEVDNNLLRGVRELK